MGAMLMSKPKGKPGPKPNPDRVRTAVIQIRTLPAWKEEIEKLADWDRASSVVELIDRAVAAYAREKGYPNPIPKR